MYSKCYINWWCILLMFLSTQVLANDSTPLSEDERLALRDEAKEMFYHAYTAYMDNAYPADELMPLSCKPRYRETDSSRGDIDDALGNFSLTLVDSLDTLVVMGDIEEFDRAVRLIVRDVSFDNDIVVSVFETNIRMVGGLISGHILAEHLNQLYGAIGWYRGQLLTMAKDLATRLLPAFNTTTGIPHARVNLKYGMKSPKLANSRETCTACAGTIILEFAALSRLTGDPIFEDKARQAMDTLWTQRHRGSDLVGTVLNVHSGDWVRRDSGVGAGIDSYYEYLLKAYVLFGDESYLERFNKHYTAVMKYISQGPMLLDVHMHRPHTTSRNFMDALLAFWPGLQVLKGDIKPAIETHEMLYQVIQRHNFLPEAFTTDFQVHWGQHPLRPEFVESTYLLHLATDDPYYLHVGQHLLRSLQKHAWVPCGYAAVKDVRTGAHEDRMDSFVLAETFKYLYLLFSKPNELIIDMDEFVFTTEAHLLPLSLARLTNLTLLPVLDSYEGVMDIDVEYARSCPNAHYLFPGRNEFAETIRKPLKNFVNNVCPTRKAIRRKLRAAEFQAGNSDHMGLLHDMGITIMALPDGRVQLLHTSSNAKGSEDAEEGLLFMQEMIELSKLQQEQPDNPPRVVSFLNWTDGHSFKTTIQAGPAQFGLDLKGDVKVSGQLVKALPLKSCSALENSNDIHGKIVLMERGDCMFVEKARIIEKLGGIGGIVLDNSPVTSSGTSPMFAMSGDGLDDVSIPLVFMFSTDAQVLLKAFDDDPKLEVMLSDSVKPGTGSIEEVELEESQSQVAGLEENSKLHNVPLYQSEGSNVGQTDDLVTVTDVPDNVESAAIVDKASFMKTALMKIQLAKTAEEILVAAVLYIKLRQDTDVFDTSLPLQQNPSSLVEELQGLLLRKTKSNPDLLRALLSVHLRELMAVLQQASPNFSDLDDSLHQLVTLLKFAETDNMVYFKSSPGTLSKPSSGANVIQENSDKLGQSITTEDISKNDQPDTSRLDQLAEKIQEKIKKLKEKYEVLIPNIEGLLPSRVETLLNGGPDKNSKKSKNDEL